jgi:hypothetical protein
MFGLLALLVFAVAGETFAGLPCAAYSSTVMYRARMTGTGLPCNECNLVWSPSGNYETLKIRVTVRDCLSAPVAACDVRLDLAGTIDPNDDLGSPTSLNGRFCGTAARTLTTNANGAVEFVVYGGGSGKVAIHWITTAVCPDPDIQLNDNWDTLCIKSFDYNGSGNVNFTDTNKYLPQLLAGSGYSSDFRNCSDANQVNFTDTNTYLPQLIAGAACPGGTSFLMTKNTSMGLDCNQIF